MFFPIMSDYDGLKPLKLRAQINPPSLSSFPLGLAIVPESLIILQLECQIPGNQGLCTQDNISIFHGPP